MNEMNWRWMFALVLAIIWMAATQQDAELYHRGAVGGMAEAP